MTENDYPIEPIGIVHSEVINLEDAPPPNKVPKAGMMPGWRYYRDLLRGSQGLKLETILSS